MATQRKAPTATPTVSLDNNDYVIDLLVSADEFVGKVRASALAVLKDRITFVITEAAKFQPLYDVVLKEHRAVNGSDAKLSASVFAGRLSERGKVLRNQSDYVFPIPDKMFASILAWSGDADEHEAILDDYLARCTVTKREPSFGEYVNYLKGYRDAEGNHYNSDGTLTERGALLAKQAAEVADAMADQQWSGFNIAMNLEGMAPAMQIAWIDAIVHDANALRARIVKQAGAGAAKVKSDARKLLDSNVSAGNPIGGDKVSRALTATS